MDVLSYVNRINTWPEYVKIQGEKKRKGEKQNGENTSGMGENRVLCRSMVIFISGVCSIEMEIFYM